MKFKINDKNKGKINTLQEFLKENSTKNKSIYTYIPIQSFLLWYTPYKSKSIIKRSLDHSFTLVAKYTYIQFTHARLKIKISELKKGKKKRISNEKVNQIKNREMGWDRIVNSHPSRIKEFFSLRYHLMIALVTPVQYANKSNYLPFDRR